VHEEGLPPIVGEVANFRPKSRFTSSKLEKYTQSNRLYSPILDYQNADSETIDKRGAYFFP
jgi:hypothetical protein